MNFLTPIFALLTLHQSLGQTQAPLAFKYHECLRNCNVDPEPRTCYFEFNLEHYMSKTRACGLCAPSSLTQLLTDCQCILGDGVERYVKSINRMLPGPSIQVCKHDEVIVDLNNLMEGEDAAIHWHGVLQNGSQYYDGVPFVTQCPIASGNSFRYRWRADKPGTHWWHSHTGLQEMDGVHGSLIVRDPRDPHDNLYDVDRADHVILISDWMHEAGTEHFPGKLVNNTGQFPRTFLINGLGWDYSKNNAGNLTVFHVEPNTRYRFRLINACGSACPSRLSIQGHKLKTIAVDGSPIQDVTVDAINSFSGERYDFVLKTKQRSGSFWVEVTGLGECGNHKVHQVALLQYSDTQTLSLSPKPVWKPLSPQAVILNPFDDFCPNDNENVICITDLRSLEQNMDREVVSENAKVDHKIYLSFQFENLARQDLFKPGSYRNFLVAGNGMHVRSLINNITSIFPSSPYMSQFEDIPKAQLCSFMDNYRDHSEHRVCSHVLSIPLNSIVEFIIVDEVHVPNLSHPFHLHGNDFYVMGMNSFPINKDHLISRFEAMKFDKRGLMKRSFGRMPLKDTLAVPRNGYIIARFRADNPGYWLMHCHFQYHMVIGMHLILKIGEHKDFPPVPRAFPKCGHYNS